MLSKFRVFVLRKIKEEDLILEKLLNDAIDITKQAGCIIMQYYKSSYGVKNKSPDNPVTDADNDADVYLKRHLISLLPEAGWLSEETLDRQDRLHKEHMATEWVQQQWQLACRTVYMFGPEIEEKMFNIVGQTPLRWPHHLLHGRFLFVIKQPKHGERAGWSYGVAAPKLWRIGFH